ncbi:MAG: HEAT repeat domain-containing protein [Verrucomicrobia bacterium]|nr:HEAT repeat domain-containing protein [Verrucomicrobiota bacterium]
MKRRTHAMGWCSGIVLAGLLAIVAHSASAGENQQASDSVEARVRALLEAASSYREEDGARRESAKSALVEIGAPAAPLLVERLDGTDVMEQLALTDVLDRIGEPAVEALHTAFAHPASERHRRRVLALIGTIGSPRSAAILVEAKRDADWAVRAAAAEGLGQIAAGDPAARACSRELLQDEDWGVRLRAVWAFADAGLAGEVDTLAALLEDGHYAVRLAAAGLLSTQGERAVGAIARRLEKRTPSPVTRLACLDALGQTRHPAAAVHIEPFLIDTDPIVRVHAALAYGHTAPPTGAPLCAALLAEESEAVVARTLRAAQTEIEAASGD